MKKLTVATLFLIIIMISGCGLPGDPVLDDFYTRNVYPGTASTYAVGSEEYPYSEGWFDTLTITDDLSVGGTLTVDAITGYGTISEANRSIYVDKEATGDADGTSWADAFTTIQAAVNDLEDVVIHSHTIYIRDGTKKTGTADENTLNHLVDDANAQFVAGDVGKRVFNVTDGTWGVVGSYVDTGDVGIIDTAGANLDLFPAGTETYVMEATPYRETVYLNSLPATNPSKLILGSVTIRAEFYFYATCDANAVAGAIVDATYDFSDIEVGDRIFVIDRNGANGRCQDYEIGTIDDVTNAATGTLGTTLTKTPTTSWDYAIVKTEISGSDDGTAGGIARSTCIKGIGMSKVTITGFYLTFSSSYAVSMEDCRAVYFYGCIFENITRGIFGLNQSAISVYYCYVSVADRFPIAVDYLSKVGFLYGVLDTVNSTTAYILSSSACNLWYVYIDNSAWGVFADRMSWVYLYRTTISANSATGIYARHNSTVYLLQSTNNGVVPENPAGTVEGAFID